MKRDKETIKKANYYFNLGKFFYEGPANGIPDFAMALINFQKADALNHRYAWEYLFEMYYYGLGTPIDKKISALYCEKEALSGNSYAQSILGKLYLRGIGVRKNYNEAENWLKKTAKKGYTTDQYLLGLLYFYGLGISRDYSRAWSWFEKAALLAWFSPEGYVNPPDINGRFWLEERARVLCKLCVMSAKGLGQEVNINEAARFYSCAMSCNSNRAKACLLKIPSSKSQEIEEIYNTLQQKVERPSSKELRKKRHGTQPIRIYWEV